MAHPEPPSTSDKQHQKRKRDADDNGQQSHDRIPQPPPPQSGNGAHINYLSRAKFSRLKLIQGDGEVFSDVLGLMNDYEGVLSRHESLAANLGAKLTGPRLVKAMEGLFEGPITVSRRDPYTSGPVTWLDIVQLAKANPSEFTLTSTPERRYCSFYLKGNHVEITEDDWRLIMSGAIDRFNLAPPQPLDEDESSELATLEILEQRLQILIKRADEVARKARQLNYHLSGRKAAINSRRTSTRSPPIQHAGFQPVNHQQAHSSRQNSAYDIHADLLQQFLSTPSKSQPGCARMQPQPSSDSLPSTPVIQQGPPNPGSQRPQSIQPIHIQSNRPSPGIAPEPHQNQQPVTTPDDPSAAHRPLITARIDKLAKGDSIFPPCDRCRRLRVTCVKHLTACQGCTKKHAKCAWKGVTDDELARLRGEAGSGEGEGTDEAASGRSGGYTPDPQSATSANPPQPLNFGDRSTVVEMRTFAPPSTNHGGGGNGIGVIIDPRNKERNMAEFGLREHPATANSRADHYRLSHMASVALNSDAREQQQQLHPQSMMPRAGSAPRD